EDRLEARARENLKTIARAMHDYTDEHDNRLPPRVVYNRDGKPLYSWRVLLLPYLGPEAKELYGHFHLDEPWDSPHNCKLLSHMPGVYASPADPSDTNTHYLTFDGELCAFNCSINKGELRPFNLVPRRFRGQVFEGGYSSRLPGTFYAGTSQTI